MFRTMSIRLRLTFLSVLILMVCCVGLTMILNLSANNMADTIEATPLIPATNANSPESIFIEYEAALIGIPQMFPSEEAIVARQTFLYQSIFYMALVVIGGGVLIYYISGEALKPLQELTNQMKNRTVHNLSEALPVPDSKDEIADLTFSFNEMSAKLDEAFAMQKRFSQSAAHELRTPLTVLKTKSDVFKKKQKHTSEEYDKLLCVITTQTDRMSNLVKDLLSLTNMDDLDCKDVIELHTLISNITLELSPAALEKQITLVVTGDMPSISGNKNLIHRAFYNLVENAIKYNTEKGRVDIAISHSQDGETITISDTGIGIPAQMWTLIFEPFFRVDSSRSRQIGGAGLGLSIVKSILEKHHSEITVSENAPTGTVFTVTIP